MSPSTTTPKLNNGQTIPALGLGCWMSKPVEGDNPETYEMVVQALKVGLSRQSSFVQRMFVDMDRYTFGCFPVSWADRVQAPRYRKPILSSYSTSPGSPDLSSSISVVLSVRPSLFGVTKQAAGYGNEKAVGRAVRDSTVPRQDIFVTTKLGFEGHSDVPGHFKQSFEALDVEYIDLFVSVLNEAMVWYYRAGPPCTVGRRSGGTDRM